jgi:(1->4)-alpha-D-glucan 1-alpha-D-glucosylmutase
MTVPRSTLRLQFHRGFTFDDALAHLDYFNALGVSHLYASPVTTATPGSTHGYDTVDYSQVSAECGGEAGLKRLADKLHERVRTAFRRRLAFAGPGVARQGAAAMSGRTVWR